MHQIDFNPVTGDLFAACIYAGGRIARFTFDASGVAIGNGTLDTGLGGLRGVVLRRTGDEMIAISYTEGIRRFQLLPSGSMQLLQSLTAHSGAGAHYGKFLGDELYVAELYSNLVARYGYDAFGALTRYESIPVAGGPMDVAFSLDKREMFVAKHFGGGIDRYRRDDVTHEWSYVGNIATTNLGGIATEYSPRLLGDVNSDGMVNIDDYLLLAAAYDSTAGDGSWDQRCDFNGDGAVNIDDYLILAANYQG